MKILKNSLLFLTFCCLLYSCKKSAGEGGNSTIRGSVWTEDWNIAFTVLNGEYPSADVDVYIIYGDDVSYGERTRANYNGEYEFKYLRPGAYKIYVYSKDKTMKSPSGNVAVIKEVKIASKKQTVTVDRITIYD